MNYGSDMTIENNPFQLMGLERLVEEQPQDYIGKDALERIRKQGVSRKLVGIEFDAGASMNCTRPSIASVTASGMPLNGTC